MSRTCASICALKCAGVSAQQASPASSAGLSDSSSSSSSSDWLYISFSLSNSLTDSALHSFSSLHCKHSSCVSLSLLSSVHSHQTDNVSVRLSVCPFQCFQISESLLLRISGLFRVWQCTVHLGEFCIRIKTFSLLILSDLFIMNFDLSTLGFSGHVFFVIVLNRIFNKSKVYPLFIQI